MKSELNFWRSLEQYSWTLVGRTPLPWSWIGVVLVVMALLLSLLNLKNSLVGARNTREAIEIAVDNGDYETAKRLLEQETKNIEYPVLGVESELEDKVYPEKNVEKRIAELENKLEMYPSNREIFLMLGDLYGQLDNMRANTGIRPYGDMAAEYREKARILDPNGVNFE